MRALVTGATGFLGAHLVEALTKSGWEVMAVCRRPVRPRLTGVAVALAELNQPETLVRVIDGAAPLDVVFHLAARLPKADEPHTCAAFLAENGVATAALLDAAARAGCRRFVYASSMGIVGSPRAEPIREDHPIAVRHPYFLGKYAGELSCTLAPEGISALAMRIASPYGSGMAENAVLSRWVDRALQGEPLELWGSGTRAQDFVHVSDVVEGLRLAAETEAAAGVFNLGSGTATTMLELAQAVRRATGENVEIQRAGRPDPEEGIRWRLDLTRTHAALGYIPRIPLSDGLTDVVDWKCGRRAWAPWWVDET